MSEHTAAAAVDSMIAVDLDDDDFGWEMFALLEAVDFEYERWCRIMGFDPDSKSVISRWEDLMWRWADTWKEIGTEEFNRMTAERVAKWRRLIDRKVRV